MKKISNFWILYALLFTISSQLYSQTLEDEQIEMLRLVNELRTERGLGTLFLSTELNVAAQKHSEDQATNNFLGHTGSDGSNFGQRVRRTEYDGFPRAENVAAGNADVLRTFNQWKNSTSGHLENMLLSDINQMGIGHDFNSNARYRHYWTQVFGRGDTTLSINDQVQKDEQNMSVFPNPVDQVLHISFGSQKQKPEILYLTSVSGQIVKEIDTNTASETIRIDTSNIPPGFYLLKTKKNVAYKVIKT